MTTVLNNMALNPLDPSVLTDIVERKGSLSLKSNHVSYGRATLNSNWNNHREAEPMDYDIRSKDAKWNLLRATYNRVGNATNGSLPEPATREALKEARDLREDYRTRTVQRSLVHVDNVHQGALEGRDTGAPRTGYGCVLPRHRDDHGARDLNTSHQKDFVYPFQWTPAEEVPVDVAPETKHRRQQTEFTDPSGCRRKGSHTWQDHAGSE